MWENACWAGIPANELRRWNIIHGDLNNRYAYFRCVFWISQIKTTELLITANSRYRLWINGKPVLSGPCKGDRHCQYYDQVDVTKYLRCGKNLLAAQVVFGDPNAVMDSRDEHAPFFNFAGTPSRHLLAVSVTGSGDPDLKKQIMTGTGKWRVYLDGSFSLTAGDEYTVNLGAVRERIDFRNTPGSWKDPDYDDSGWAEAEVLRRVLQDEAEASYGSYGAYRITERPIPLLFEREKSLVSDAVIIPPNTKMQQIVIGPYEHMNAYLHYRFGKGKNAGIRLIYSEKLPEYAVENMQTKKISRPRLRGMEDRIVLDGEMRVYEPFWMKTFRTIILEIETEEEELILHEVTARVTGYPLVMKSLPELSDPRKEKLREISIRTLRNCMLDSYVDCPYYEQMQFPMDTRLQALFTYCISDDTRLAKKALDDFHRSMIPEGLIQGKYPCAFPQIISTFSLHYIYMLEEYYLQTKDLSVLQHYRTDVDVILEYYARHIGDMGLVENPGYWSFVDWQEEWKGSQGVPSAALKGPSTIINLMYMWALRAGGNIYKWTGRTGMAEEYRSRREKIKKIIMERCWDPDRMMFREGPDYPQFSQHAQAWAVLNDLADPETARIILERAVEGVDVIPCSFSTSFELFRAYEKAGIYDKTELLLEKWLRLVDTGYSTCPEEPMNPRSECHGWSALPIYESRFWETK